MDSKGQSTLEFTLTLILLFAFILFYFRLTLVFGYGSFVHYATFMSARSYLASGPTIQDQTDRARQTFSELIESGNGGGERYKVIARGDANVGDPAGLEIGKSPQFIPGIRPKSWAQGVRYTFKSRIFVIPLSGLKSRDRLKDPMLKLTSESWLGREPAESECRDFMEKNGFIYDNGC